MLVHHEMCKSFNACPVLPNVVAKELNRSNGGNKIFVRWSQNTPTNALQKHRATSPHTHTFECNKGAVGGVETENAHGNIAAVVAADDDFALEV